MQQGLLMVKSIWLRYISQPNKIEKGCRNFRRSWSEYGRRYKSHESFKVFPLFL